MFFGVFAILFHEKRKILIISLIGLFFFLGIWRYAVSIQTDYPDKIKYYNGQEILFQGFVNQEPDVRQNNQKLEIRVKNAEPVSGIFIEMSGKVLVSSALYPAYHYGDFLEIRCFLREPERFNGFSYDRYLARYDIYSVCYWPKSISQVYISEEEDKKNISSSGLKISFYKNIYALKDGLRQKINYGMREPEASLAKAMILGDKRQIPNDLREKFSQAGLSHLVAISGMHISIIAGILMMFFLQIGLKRCYAFYFSSIFLFIYIAMIGFPPSAIRAGIMGFLVLLALNFGRLNKLSNSLFLAAAILLFINPRLLRDDIGFQLSFLAVLGIALVYPILDGFFNKIMDLVGNSRLFSFLEKGKFFYDILNITVSAQVFTLPIIAVNFHQVSLVVVLSNLLVIWILPIFMISAMLALILSFLFPDFGTLFFLPAEIMLKYIIIVADNLIKLPYASIKFYYLWWFWVVWYYVFALFFIKIIKKKFF